MLYLNDDIQAFDLAAALPLLSEQRREQCLRFKHELGRKQCALAYLLLCEGLRKEYGITEKPLFEYGEHGKPALVGLPHVYFNLSHCKEAVVCMIDRQPVGVDVESIGRFKESLARYVMNDDELQLIHESDELEVAFTRLWTMKEAVLKLSGEGLCNDVKNVLSGFSGQMETTVNKTKGYVYTIAR